MSDSAARTGNRAERRAATRAANRAGILEAARRVAGREGAHGLSLRAVAAEAGYAPAAVYGYFDSRAELVLALAADDLGRLAKSMRETSSEGFAKAARRALSSVERNGALAAAAGSLEADGAGSEAERHFNGKLIAVLTALAEAAGRPVRAREEQADVVLTAAALAGLALLARAGRLKVLGFSEDELIERLDRRFASGL